MKFYYPRLKDLKEDMDLKQKDVANIIGVAENHYGKYERGEVDITFARVIELAKFYGVSLDYIAGLTNDKGGLHCNFLDSEKKELLQSWDLLQSSDKDLILAMIDKFVDKKPNENARKSVI